MVKSGFGDVAKHGSTTVISRQSVGFEPKYRWYRGVRFCASSLFMDEVPYFFVKIITQYTERNFSL